MEPELLTDEEICRSSCGEKVSSNCTNKQDCETYCVGVGIVAKCESRIQQRIAEAVKAEREKWIKEVENQFKAVLNKSCTESGNCHLHCDEKRYCTYFEWQ